MSAASRSLLACALFALAEIATAGSIARQTARLPELSAPPQGDAQWIAPSMRLNGLPMTLKSFRSNLPVDAVLSHYESWARSQSSTESRRSRQGDAQTLTIRNARYQMSIEATPARRGCEGTLMVSAPLETVALRTESSFPRPGDNIVVNLQEYDDDGIEAEHISLSSPRAIAAEAHRYSRLLRQAGWQIVREREANWRTSAHVIEAQDGAQHAQLTFTKDPVEHSRTAIVIVWKKS